MSNVNENENNKEINLNEEQREIEIPDFAVAKAKKVLQGTDDQERIKSSNLYKDLEELQRYLLQYGLPKYVTFNVKFTYEQEKNGVLKRAKKKKVFQIKR